MTWTARFYGGGPLDGRVLALPANDRPPTTHEVVLPAADLTVIESVRREYHLIPPFDPLRRLAFYRYEGSPSTGSIFEDLAVRVDHALGLLAERARDGPVDVWPEDPAADLCWCCDLAASQSDIGLCMDCRADLTQETT